MKSMLVAAAVVGLAIAGLILLFEKNLNKNGKSNGLSSENGGQLNSGISAAERNPIYNKG